MALEPAAWSIRIPITMAIFFEIPPTAEAIVKMEMERMYTSFRPYSSLNVAQRIGKLPWTKMKRENVRDTWFVDARKSC